MKSKLLFLSLLLIAGYTTSAQVSLGVQGGVVLSNVSGEQASLPLTSKPQSKFSWQAGLMADVPFGEGGFRLLPELKFVNKGFKASDDIAGLGSASGSVGLSYIELPVNLGYALDLGGAKLLVGAGPYLGFGIGGNVKYDVTIVGGGTQSIEEDVEFGSGEDQLKAFDYGANFMAGVLFGNGFMVKANYSLGLANLSNAPESSFKNNYLGFSLVYFLKRAGE